jgi:BolA protein
MITTELLSQKLAKAFTPAILEIEDESHKHAGHNQAAAQGGTHFKVLIVSAAFEGLSRVQRHQRVYIILEGELQGSLHALALKTLTPAEYNAQK